MEVPVLLALTWVALYLRTRLKWTPNEDTEFANGEEKGSTKGGALPAPLCETSCRR